MGIAVGLSYVGIAAVSVAALFVEVSVYVHMMIATMLTLYIGSQASLEAQESKEAEKMERKDALMFPVIGSVVLLSLYLVYKFLPQEYVDVVVKVYFAAIGTFALATSLKSICKLAFSLEKKKGMDETVVTIFLPIWMVGSPKENDDEAEDHVLTRAQESKLEEKKAQLDEERQLCFSIVDILCLLVGAGIAYFQFTSGHWITSNMFGYSFSIQGIALLNLGSFMNGAILLVGLFFYDIFWVFGTDVMVTVATKFNAPIKLLFPRALGSMPPSMLGLGDIVIPGIFIALLYRFDHSRAPKDAKTFSKPYFISVIIGYFIGLSLTVYIMYAFQHAQPALLYLVPGCLIPALFTALVRGELMLLVNYEEAEHDKEETSTKKDK